MYYIGIDTSAYTTSLAVVDVDGRLCWDGRRILDVPHGERGLAQSEAFFQHVQNLPTLIDEVPGVVWKKLSGVGVSIAPRPVPGSYMPVFTAGIATAKAIAAAAQVPLLQTTHQEGHIAAGVASSQEGISQKFLAVHLSGGTTELLLVEKNTPGQYSIELLGGTTDLHAGQFVDRVGVMLGLEFPAGKHLETIAKNARPHAERLLPSSVRGFNVSFSGVETAARRLYEQGTPAADVARAVEGCVARTISKLIIAGIEKTACRDVLLVGGVASNEYIKQEIKRRVGARGRVLCALPDWSRDNAIGVALLAREVAIYFNI